MRPIHCLVAFVFVSTSPLTTVGCSSSASPEEDKKESSSASSTSASASEEASSSFCSSYCDKVAECDSSSDAQTCAETCNTQIRNALGKMRSDVVEDTKACWQKSDCRMVLSGHRLGDCLNESIIGVAPTETAKSFCDQLGASFRKCDSGLDYAKCLSSMKAFGDDTLEQAKKCTDKACKSITSCVDATLSS